MEIVNMPFCCTSAVLGSFGEHGESSVVTVEEVKRLVRMKLRGIFGQEDWIENPKRCVLAISVDPANIRVLKEAGFKVVDAYEGIQGKVHILSFHAEPIDMGKQRPE